MEKGGGYFLPVDVAGRAGRVGAVLEREGISGEEEEDVVDDESAANEESGTPFIPPAPAARSHGLGGDGIQQNTRLVQSQRNKRKKDKGIQRNKQEER